MTDLNLQPEAPAKSWRSKIDLYLLSLGLIILLASLAWFAYLQFYFPSYQLTDFLPEKYDFALLIKEGHKTLADNQLNLAKQHPAFKPIYEKFVSSTSDLLNRLPDDEKNLISQSPQGLLFCQNPADCAAIIVLNQAEAKLELSDLKKNGLKQKIIDQKFLIIASQNELLDQLAAKPKPKASFFNFSIEFLPWLTIYLQNSFFSQPYNNPLLTDLQTILQPLKSASDQSYTLSLSLRSNQLVLNLEPKKQQISATNKITLDDYLPYLPVKADLIFGLSDLSSLETELNNNQNLAGYFQQFQTGLWQSYQISVEQLKKQLQGPIIIAFENSNWWLITNSQNEKIIQVQLKNYLAQLNPIKITKVLPDRTKAVELMADPKSVSFESRAESGWQIQTPKISDSKTNLGYALKDKVLILSNVADYGPKNHWSLTKYGCDLSPISTFFSLKTKQSNLDLAASLLNFKRLTSISDNNGLIKLCLDL
jgi:hypothetical protein